MGSCWLPAMFRPRLSANTRGLTDEQNTDNRGAFGALALPALVLGQTYVGDVGIEKDDVKIGAKESRMPFL